MSGSYLLRGKSDPFDGLSKAGPTKLPKRRHEEGPRGGNGSEKQLCDNRGIRIGQSSEAKASFWPKVLEDTEKTDSNEIQSTAEGVREATGWECPVDKNNVYALCQLHEVYVDEK